MSINTGVGGVLCRAELLGSHKRLRSKELAINTELLVVCNVQHHKGKVEASDNLAELIPGEGNIRKQKPVGHVTPLNLHTN